MTTLTKPIFTGYFESLMQTGLCVDDFRKNETLPKASSLIHPSMVHQKSELQVQTALQDSQRAFTVPKIFCSRNKLVEPSTSSRPQINWPECRIPKPDEIDMVIYHGDCSSCDGPASKWVAWSRLKNRAVYIPASYYDDLPDITGKNVVILDFSYTPEQMRILLEQANSLLVLDHHYKPAQLLKGLKNARINQKHCGAYLAWRFFYPNKAVPDFIKYIEDYDLWKLKYKDTKEFTFGLSTYKKKIEDFDLAMRKLTTEEIIEKGRTVLKGCREISMPHYIRQSQIGTIQGHNVSYAELSELDYDLFRSEIAEAIYLQKECDYALVYKYDPDKKHYSIKIRRGPEQNSINLSEIAMNFDANGGGHAQAAGFSWRGAISTLFDIK